jgi:hypothetical protein
MLDRAEWQRLYADFRAVEEELHDGLPPVVADIGGADLAVGLDAVDVDRTAALIEVMRQRWIRFQEYAES